MIAGFGGGARYQAQHSFSVAHTHALPIPFNIPKVLHNILFEELDLDLNNKQKDIIEAVRFSYTSLLKVQKIYGQKEAELKSRMFSESDNIELKRDYQDIVLDSQQANYDFKSLVTTMSDMLVREQFEKLLKFSNIPV